MSKVVVDLFLSEKNINYLSSGASKKHFNKLLPEFVTYMCNDMKKNISMRSNVEQVIKYNELFKKILYEHTMNEYDTESMSSINIGVLNRGNYSSDPDSLLASWNSNVARQVQTRQDRQQYIADEEPDYDLIGCTSTNGNLTDFYTSASEAFTDLSSVFESKQMKQLNATGYGYSMTHDDYDSALALQEQIFGSSDLNAENGFFGVRSDINHKERKNHNRPYDIGNDGLTGTELEGLVMKKNMKNIRRHY